MKILALDVAKKTGWAVWDTSKPPSSMQTGVITLEGSTTVDRIRHMRREFPPILNRHKPDFVAIEAPLPNVKTSSTISFQLNALYGAAVMMCLGFNIPVGDRIFPNVWQKIIPKSISRYYLDATGKEKDGGQKRRVRILCDQLAIIGKDDNARDAAIIALWARGHCQELKWLEATNADIRAKASA